MRPARTPFTGPFFDTYGIGFALYQPDRNNWKQRTVAGVSWNGLEGKAHFFNPDGLVLPLVPSHGELPAVLRLQRTRMEPAKVMGSGVFAMTHPAGDAVASSELSQWVTYWFVGSDAAYANSPEVWSAYVDSQVAAECKAAEHNYVDARRISHRAEQSTELPWQSSEHEQTCDGLSEWVRVNTEDCRRMLRAEYERECAEDQRVAAWLRGCAG
ncbi:hypothetical protein [Pseudomonas putida]|uniref:Uncharacterized protein n=1 Tax=Pseudomonas putida TaxID=303 RepID=A0A1Q9RBA0_PSEPU|nr:hypothetical protein [Pseudomonas putida]OLS64638.1 hypothetical protein PSEMO_03660 [Pseudomonas putida]